MNLAFFVRDLSANVLSEELINSINQSHNDIDNNNDIDVVIFCESLEKPFKEVNCAVMPSSDAWIWPGPGPLIVTSLSTASKALHFFSQAQLIFYISELEWTLIKNKNYLELLNIYNNPKLKLVCRNESHKVLIENNWNAKITAVIPEINPQTIMKFIEAGEG